jgi:hypothetical protein
MNGLRSVVKVGEFNESAPNSLFISQDLSGVEYRFGCLHERVVCDDECGKL